MAIILYSKKRGDAGVVFSEKHAAGGQGMWGRCSSMRMVIVVV